MWPFFDPNLGKILANDPRFGQNTGSNLYPGKVCPITSWKYSIKEMLYLFRVIL